MPRRHLDDQTPWHTHLLNLARTGSPAAQRALTPGTALPRQTLARFVLPGSAQRVQRRLPSNLPAEFLPWI